MFSLIEQHLLLKLADLLLDPTHGGLQLKGQGVVLVFFVLKISLFFLYLLSKWPQLFDDGG